MTDPTRLTADELLSQLHVQFERNQQLDMQVAALRAELAQARQRLDRITNAVPKSGPNAVLDQTDADNYYISEENRKLRTELAQAQQSVQAARNGVRDQIVMREKVEAKLAQVEQERDDSELSWTVACARWQARAEHAEAELTALKARLTPGNLIDVLTGMGALRVYGTHIELAKALAQRLTDAPAPATFPSVPLTADLTAENVRRIVDASRLTDTPAPKDFHE